MNRDKAVAIFGSSRTQPDSPEWIEAERAGERCAAAGLTVITGGYGGTMEAASRGAAMAGGQVIGVTAPSLFVSRDGANPHVTREIAARTLTERIGTLMELATGVIALPGSIGTAAELLIAWNANHIARRNGGRRIPAVGVGDAWHELWTLLSDRLGAFGGDVHIAAHADEGLDWLLSQPEIG